MQGLQDKHAGACDVLCPGCSVLKESTGQGFRILDPQSSHTVVFDLGYHSLMNEAIGSRKGE